MAKAIRHGMLALVFMASEAAAQFCPGLPPWVFDDVPISHQFCTDITWMAQRGITLGCAAIDPNHRLYCPNDYVTRAQMAAFMYRLGFENAFLHGGNAFAETAILGTTDNYALDIEVNNSRVMRYEPNAISPNVIGGSPANNVTAGVRGATIAGGGVPFGDTDPDYDLEAPNQVTDIYGTVGGGYANRAGDDAGTTLDRPWATVAGGLLNTASGDYSFAAGVRAKATHHRSFVWGGDGSNDTVSQSDGSFTVYAPSAVRMFAGPPGSGGCTLTSGASGWSCASDRALKTGIENVDGRDVLDQVVALPIARWSFTSVPGVLHIGPMAQDFHAAFGLGDDATRLAPMDVQGVALAAIQGLNTKLHRAVDERDEQIAELKAALARSSLALSSSRLAGRGSHPAARRWDWRLPELRYLG